MPTVPEIKATMYALAFLEGVAHTHPNLSVDIKTRIDTVLAMAKAELDTLKEMATLAPIQVLPPVEQPK